MRKTSWDFTFAIYQRALFSICLNSIVKVFPSRIGLINGMLLLFNSFMTEAVMDWFQFDNGLRHERVKKHLRINQYVFGLVSWGH